MATGPPGQPGGSLRLPQIRLAGETGKNDPQITRMTQIQHL